MEEKNLPIGYWVKQVDTLLSEGIDRIQVVHGISRTGWQLLNTIKQEGSIDKSSLNNFLKPFAKEDEIEHMVEEMATKGWLTSQNDVYSLTVSGEVFYEDCFQQQIQFRQKAMQGISNAAYETTVNTLQKMVSNLSE